MDFEKIKQTVLATIPAEKIIVFGSYAWGTPNEDSDLDLFVVSNSSEDVMQQTLKINMALFSENFPLDVYVIAKDKLPEKIEKNKLVRKIIHDGKSIYSKS